MTDQRACLIMLVSASLLEFMAASLFNGEYQVIYTKKAYSDERPLLRDLHQRCGVSWVYACLRNRGVVKAKLSCILTYLSWKDIYSGV